jgi:hypothetical protein
MQRPCLWVNFPWLGLGRAMAQVVSSRSLTVESRVRARVSPCGICGGQGGTGTGLSPSFFGFPLSISFHRGTHMSSER